MYNDARSLGPMRLLEPVSVAPFEAESVGQISVATAPGLRRRGHQLENDVI